MRLTLLTTALCLLAFPALACSPVVSNLTLKQKADAAQLVFIGKVETVTPEKVSFVTGAGHHISIVPMNNTCGIAFTVGEVWLYIGPEGYSGSRRLRPEDLNMDIKAALAEPAQ